MLNTELANTLNSFLPFALRILVNVGTKAAKKVPSDNIFRKKFVILKAEKNTSESIPTPEYLAIRESLAKPSILAIIEKKLITKADLKICIYRINFNI